MKNERAVCDRNSDLKGNLLVWITSKQLKLHQKHKMALIQYCLSATWRLSFLSHFWAEKSPSLMNGARFCIQICRNDGLILNLHCRQIVFIFANVAFSQFLTLEIAYSEKLRHMFLFGHWSFYIFQICFISSTARRKMNESVIWQFLPLLRFHDVFATFLPLSDKS